MNEHWIAVVMGLVEGFTEFLPVSSTGHLILVGHLLGFDGETAKLFEVFIQLGAILAVVTMYTRTFAELFSEPSGPGFSGYNGILFLGLTTLPAVVVGRASHAAIKAHLFGPDTVAVGLAAGAVWILVAERLHSDRPAVGLSAMTWRMALGIGLFQCLALWPGMSRSTCTILGAMMLGLDRASAVKYSFFAAVPVMTLAVAYDLLKNASLLTAETIPWFAIGFIVAYLSAAAAIRFFLHWISRHGLAPFAWYRLAVAAAVWLLL
ncbi:MAG: undecaprenyl-diphosphate phosphatase [Kiritimatiellae bacterium]|nr:undecaprenyl-diphosphate phosphatase [Kiritimatiellia bacterium]MDW8459051.1 undecaprenyl-diphosphate phosphatase [Verrucomicrobiota bacterium]